MPTAFEDKFAIEELIARYNHSLDGGDYATWVNCWADDAVMDGMGNLLTGRAQIQAYADAYEGKFRSRFSGLKHFTTNILTVLNGDTATSTAGLQLVTTTDKGVKILATGLYEDSYRRVNGEWKFTQRKLHQDMPPKPVASPSA